LSLRVITDVNEFDKVRADWDCFVARTGTNWYLLSGFVRTRMIHSRKQGRIPLAVLRLTEGSVVGVCAFEIRIRYGLRFAKFLLPAEYSPDFLVAPRHRQSFVEATLELLLERMRCQAVTLVLPKGSPQETAPITACARKRLRTTVMDVDKHSILVVDGTWREFESRRGSNFRNHFKKIEAKLIQTGPWRTPQERANSPESVTKITTIESHSWKHRARRDQKLDIAALDPTLLAYTTFRGSEPTETLCPQAWFLEIGATPVAYVIVVEINGVACLAKTSYDDRFRNLYPGEYIQNVAIKSLFDGGRVSRIDFMTFLRYHGRWTSLHEKREALRISHDGFARAHMGAMFERVSHARRFGVKLLPDLFKA